jgi:hypothetical protein
MGPTTLRWYEDNNIPYTIEKAWLLGKCHEYKKYVTEYCGGRVDVHTCNTDEYPFGIEYGISIMEQESWDKLKQWLNNLSTDRVLEKQELLDMFEEQNKHKIKWFKK